MSAEATIAVMEHANGTDAEWRLLAILANSADHEGVVSMSREELADKVHKTEKSVSIWPTSVWRVTRTGVGPNGFLGAGLEVQISRRTAARVSAKVGCCL